MDLVISIFKIKLMSLLGFTPIIDRCANCKKTDSILNHFSFKDSGLKCDACSRADKGALEVCEATVNAIKYIIMAPPKNFFHSTYQSKRLRSLKLLLIYI